MAIEGRLEDVSIPDIMQLLAMGRKTGCLTVTDRANFGYIYLEDGRVIYATVLNRPNRLGELLVRNAVISRDELSQAMEQQAREPGRRLGGILVERGSLTSEQLQRYITIQIEEAVYHLFSWKRGSFHFDVDARPDEPDLAGASIHAESLLLEGARRVDEWSLIQKKIPTMDLVFTVERRPDPDSDEVELTRDQVRLLEMVDGEQTVDDLVQESGLVEFDVAKALYGLLQAGYVRRTGRKNVSRTPGEDPNQVAQLLNVAGAYYRARMFEEAEREYRAILEVDEHEATARKRLALLALRGRRFSEALEHYASAPEAAREEYAALRNQALALEHLGRPEEALELLDRAAARRPGDPELALARAILLLQARRFPEASAAFRGYRESLPAGKSPPPLYHAHAVLGHAAVGKADDALAAGREGLALYPDEGAILVNLGTVLEDRGETAAAEALYLRAVGEGPTPPQAHKNLGDMAVRRGDQAGARAHFELAARLNPELGDDLFLKLGNLAYKVGDREDALRHWKRALELNPENEVVRTNLELVASTHGR